MITIQELDRSTGVYRWVFKTKITWVQYQEMSKYLSNEGKTWRAIL